MKRGLRLTTLTSLVWLMVVCGCTDSTTYARHAPRKLAPYGVRVGLLQFGDFDKLEMADAISVGYYHRLGVRGSTVPEIVVETAKRSEGDSDWEFYMVGGNIIFLPSRRDRFYIHGGAGVMSETLPGSSYTAAYACAGLGYSLPAAGTALDIRLTGNSIIDSANANTVVSFTLGVGF